MLPLPRRVSVGATPYNVAVPDLGIDQDMPPGDWWWTMTIPLDAAPGMYQFVCNVPGHAPAGMRGWLVVE